jgi:integrase
MRKYLSRLSEKLFPRKNKSSTKVGPLISAYLFRHALASDLCEDGWSEIAIASVLGHSVSETARQYGVRVRSRSQKTISVIIDPNHVETARKVRAQMKFNPVELGLRISEINTIHKS